MRAYATVWIVEEEPGSGPAPVHVLDAIRATEGVIMADILYEGNNISAAIEGTDLEAINGTIEAIEANANVNISTVVFARPY